MDGFHETNESFAAEPVETVDDKSKKKKRTVEDIYQKKTPLEHILLRPDTYVGSIEKTTASTWIFDEATLKMNMKEINYVPALYKIFDEILVNAADNKIRDKSMNTIKVDIKPDENMVRVWNNGQGIPVEHHKQENMWVPTMIFGHLLTSSNYDDSERKVTGGRNGYGAKLCNIFSEKFIVETSSRKSRKSFKQTWISNMTKANDPVISEPSSEDFTCITFYPDLKRFGMRELEQDIIDLYKRRALDVAASCPGLKVFLNSKRLNVTSFREYVDLFLKDPDNSDEPIKCVYEKVNDRWEVAVAPSSGGFKQMSFVNSIATTQGGKHVDYIVDQLCNKMVDTIKKKTAKTGVSIRGKDLRNYLQVFINCQIENPAFSSQTKEHMNLEPKKFGSTCELTEKFINASSKCGVVDLMMSWVKFKALEKMDKQCHKSKHSKLKGIPKLDDANDAGTKNSQLCTLILTEGDSAKSLAVAGLGVIGRDHYGVFPLRGKLLNVREAATKQLTANAEINNLIKIIGLQYNKNYESADALKSLRYGKVMIMTDQDQDGSHIKGLVINFFHTNWPHLLKHNFVEEFITPIVKVFKGNRDISFYSLPEFEEWLKDTPNSHTWRVKYYKGLGTSSSKEAKEYFSDMQRHRIRFNYAGQEDDSSIMLAFSKAKIEERKTWLTRWMEERRRRAELGLPQDFLYGKDTRAVSYHEFVHKELVLFSNMDNERSIPSMVDGLKPGQRKVMFTFFKRNLIKEIKVAQVAGSISEISAYHHGETSLMSTIIGLAQDYVGANNLNLLMPHGQFGTRLTGGDDAASPRYIFTSLNPVTRAVFSQLDEALYKYVYDDNQRVEPEWYCPIIPMVLINGAQGIGTGWSTKIPNYNVLDVITALRRLIEGQAPQILQPSYRGFRGQINEYATGRYVVYGICSILDETTIEISELPVRVWTQSYKENVLEPMLNGTEKIPAVIQDYKEYHTDRTVRFVVKLTEDKLRQAELQGLYKFFRLYTTFTTTSMVLFDQYGCIKRYESVDQIMNEFFTVRMDLYRKRKSYMEGMLAAESSKLENQARFVLEKCEGKIHIENKAKKALIALLKSANYASDPVRCWRACVEKQALLEEMQQERENAVGTVGEEEEEEGLDYNYILNMPLWSLSLERKNDLLAQRDKKREELNCLRKKTPEMLYQDDLGVLEKAYNKQLEDADKELEEAHEKARKKLEKTVGGGQRGKQKNAFSIMTVPDPKGQLIEPKMDQELVKKASENKIKEVKKKIQKRDNNDDIIDDENDDDDIFGSRLSDKKPLLERISMGLNDGAKDAFQELMSKKEAPAKKAAPKRRKTEPTKKQSGVFLTDDEEDPELSPKKVRNMAPRNATSKSNYIADSSGSDKDDDSDDYQLDESEDSDFAQSPKKKKGVASPAKKSPVKAAPVTAAAKPKPAAAKPKRHTEPKKKAAPIVLDSDGSIPVLEDSPKKPAAKKAAPKKKADAAPKPKKSPAKKKKAAAKFSGSEDEADEDNSDEDKNGKSGDFEPVIPRAKNPRGATKAKKTHYVFEDSEDSDDVPAKKKKNQLDSSDESFMISD